MTDKDLYEFVYRADTAQKVATAERWLREHKDIMSPHTFDGLISTLNMQSKRIYFVQIAEQENSFRCIYDLNNNIYLTDTTTGEVVAYA